MLGNIFITQSSLLLTLLHFLLIVLSIFVGFRLGKLKLKDDPKASESLGGLDGGIYGLVALLLAFTFSLAASRYEKRRDVMLQEANAVGTAILRTDLFPDSIAKVMRGHFSSYIDQRAVYYHAGLDTAKINAAYQKANSDAMAVWKMTSSYARTNQGTAAGVHMIPALNEMIDLMSTRRATINQNVPPSVLWLLVIFTFAGAFFNGYSNGLKGRMDKLIALVFALFMSLTMFLIIDLDRPRRGLITINEMEEYLQSNKELLK